MSPYPECESLTLPDCTDKEFPDSEGICNTPAPPHPGSNVFKVHKHKSGIVKVANNGDSEGSRIGEAHVDKAKGAQHLRAPGDKDNEEEQAVVAPVQGQVPAVPQPVRPHWQNYTTEIKFILFLNGSRCIFSPT